MKITLPPHLSILLLLGSALFARADDVIRIKAGLTAPLTDETGVVWQADKGFAGGDIIERPDITVANTRTPSVYRSERYSMSAFRRPVPNGKYTVRLHFAETYEDIYAPGQRVFSFEVEGREFKDFDVWQKAGGALRAHVETVEVEVTDGFLDISFTHKIENPQICALEIFPQR